MLEMLENQKALKVKEEGLKEIMQGEIAAQSVVVV